LCFFTETHELKMEIKTRKNIFFNLKILIKIKILKQKNFHQLMGSFIEF